MENILPIVIIVAIVLLVLIYAFFLYKRLNGEKRDDIKRIVDERRTNVRASRVSAFIPPKVRAFYNALRSAMPPNYIIMPNIAVELLFKRTTRRDLAVVGQYATVAIFTDRFAPVLIINLRDFSATSDATFLLPDRVKDMLRTAGIPIMEYDIRDNYSIDDLRKTVARTMNPLL